MIPIGKSSARGTQPVRLVVIHTAEGARTTGELANYFSGPVEASSHAGIDETKIEQYLPYDRAAWTMLSANGISDQAELCGFASWTREQWLTQHAGMIGLAAQWIRERCLARGIPLRKLTPAQVCAGEAGVCGHWDWTVGMADGTHTDPGSGFPWDVVIAAAAGTGPAPTPPPSREVDPMTAVPIVMRADGTFRGTLCAESGGGSQVVAQAWLDLGCTWGSAQFRATALGANAAVLATWPEKTPPGTLVRIPNNGTAAGIVLPPGTQMVTVEGRVDDPAAGTIPAATVIAKAR